MQVASKRRRLARTTHALRFRSPSRRDPATAGFLGSWANCKRIAARRVRTFRSFVPICATFSSGTARAERGPAPPGPSR